MPLHRLVRPQGSEGVQNRGKRHFVVKSVNAAMARTAQHHAGIELFAAIGPPEASAAVHLARNQMMKRQRDGTLAQGTLGIGLLAFGHGGRSSHPDDPASCWALLSRGPAHESVALGPKLRDNARALGPGPGVSAPVPPKPGGRLA